MCGGSNKRAAYRGVGSFVLLAVALALGGCGSTDLLKSSPLDLFGSSSKVTKDKAADPNTVATDDVECPEVKIRTGAATLMIGSKPGEGEPAALDVRYQGSILRTARECHVNAGIMTMKIGIEGRIITGPAGGPGTLDVPLRIAVVQGGVSEKTIATKAYRTTVTMTEEGSTPFTIIADDIVYPAPPAAVGDAYIFYIGFDPQALGPEAKPKAPRKKK